MPVPSSWNDITQNDSLKEYIGWVWYEREAWVPSLWAGLRIVLRFESAHYNAIAVSSYSYYYTSLLHSYVGVWLVLLSCLCVNGTLVCNPS